MVSVDGLLELREVQPAGKRAMSGAEYRRGQRTLPVVAASSPKAEPDRPR
jgi:methionyl-tRNA formyltransferase